VQVAEIDRALVGVCQLTFAKSRANLEKLFVDPSYLGRGIGKRLYRWAERLARLSYASEMSIEADPGAASFYRRMGAIDDGMVASGSIPGRRIPRLRVVLHQIEMEENWSPRQ
jgi:GNAT superfamily N-acetyltransferase